MSKAHMRKIQEQYNDIFSKLEKTEDYGRFLEFLISQSEMTLGFTGAGVSTESGIPDYRSAGSLWEKNKFIPYDAFMKSEKNRVESWKRKFVMDDVFGLAQPGIPHKAFANCVQKKKMSAIITQNIDGLHQVSGVPDQNMIELHGNATYATCLSCSKRYELNLIRQEFEKTQKAPVCEECGGIVKDAIISFGQAMPEQAMRRAQENTLACDLFIVAGSSLVVYPAAGFPLLAKENGATLVILNRDPTELDRYADFVIHGELGSILQPLVRSEFQIIEFSLE